MRQLSDNQPAVESFLAILGPGNWGGPSRPALSAQAEETSLMTRYLSTSHFFFEDRIFGANALTLRRRSHHPPRRS